MEKDRKGNGGWEELKGSTDGREGRK